MARVGLISTLVGLGAFAARVGPPARLEPGPAPAAPTGTVEVRVAGVVAGGKDQAPNAVLLSPVDARIGLVIPMLVSRDEASAVTTRLKHQSAIASEPAAQLGDTLRELGAILERVEIDDLAPMAARGRLELRQQGRRLEVRARGADSIALALDAGVPLVVPRSLLSEGRSVDDPSALAAPPAPATPSAPTGVRL